MLDVEHQVTELLQQNSNYKIIHVMNTKLVVPNRRLVDIIFNEFSEFYRGSLPDLRQTLRARVGQRLDIKLRRHNRIPELVGTIQHAYVILMGILIIDCIIHLLKWVFS